MRRSELELKKGSILRKELLEDIYSFPRIATETYYSGYSDGILYGLEWERSNENKGHHIITPGALKFHGEIYFLSESIDVEELLGEQIQIDKKYRLCFEEQEGYKNIETQTIFELKLRAVQADEYSIIKEKSFYYARVRCTDNNSLETFYDNDVYGLFASKDGYAFKLPNWIVKEKLLKEIEEKHNKHPLDYMIMKEAYEKNGLAVSMIDLYLRECGVELNETDYLSPSTLVEKLVNSIGLLQSESIMIKNDDDPEPDFLPRDGGLLT